MISILEKIAEELSAALRENRTRGYQQATDEQLLEDNLDNAADYFERRFGFDSERAEKTARDIIATNNILSDIANTAILSALKHHFFEELLEKPDTVIDAASVDALNFLRSSFDPDMPVINSKPKFPGVREAGMKASEFYLHHYGQDDRISKSMHGGLLRQVDEKLYNALTKEAHKGGVGIGHFLPTYEMALDARRDAVACLLGLEPTEAARRRVSEFFTTLRQW